MRMRNPPRHVALALVAGAVLVAPAAGLAGGDDRLSAGTDYTVAGALAEIPAPSADSFLITTADVSAASELDGLERPRDFDEETFASWRLPITGLALSEPGETPVEFAPVPVVLPDLLFLQQGAKLAEIDDTVGWTVADVDSFVSADAPPDHFLVAAGDFDDTTLAAGLDDRGGGVVSLGDGDDFAVARSANLLNQVGVAQRMAVSDGRIAVSPSTEQVRDWLASDTDPASDVPELAEIAGVLDAADTVSAVMARLDPLDLAEILGPRATPDQVEAIRDRLGETVMSTPVDTVGIGWNADDSGSATITVAYHVTDEADVDAAATAVEAVYRDGTSFLTGEPISDLVVVDDVTMTGSTVVVMLHPADGRSPISIFDMLTAHDLPFAIVA